MFNQGTTEIFLRGQCDDNSGDIGLAYDGCQFVFHNGTLGAHDLIEHVNGVHNIGSGTDEFQAIGAIYYTRMQNGYKITERGLVNDLLSVARDTIYADDFGPFIPTQPESDSDSSFEWIIEQFQEKIAQELDAEALENFEIDHYCDQALQGMRLGESKQDTRFPTSWKACEMFKAVEGAINKYFGIAETYTYNARNSFECEEWQEFKLTITQNETGLIVEFDDLYEVDEDLCTECGSVLEDDKCEDCTE